MLRNTYRQVSGQVLCRLSPRCLDLGWRTRSGPQRALSIPPPHPAAQLHRSDCSRVAASAAPPAVSEGPASTCCASAEPQYVPRRSCCRLARLKPTPRVKSSSESWKSQPGFKLCTGSFLSARWQQWFDWLKGNYPACLAAARGFFVFLKETAPPLAQHIARHRTSGDAIHQFLYTLGNCCVNVISSLWTQ